MIPQVRPNELNDWLQQHGGAPLVVDVRESWELETASIKPDSAFEFLAIPMNDVPARLGELDPARPIAILCHTGRRSQRVAMFLAEQGYGQVANIAGGIEAWANERDPSVAHY